MIGELTLENFQPRLGEEFTIQFADARFETSLIEANAIETRAEITGRAPFSLVFRGPKEPVLDQATYELENQALGKLQLFLVPIGPDAQGMRYEAVFT